MNAAAPYWVSASGYRSFVEGQRILLLPKLGVDAAASDRVPAPGCRSLVKGQRILFAPKSRVDAAAPHRVPAVCCRRFIEGQRILLSPCRIRVCFHLRVDDVKVTVELIDIHKVGLFRLGQPVIRCPGRQTDHPLLCVDMDIGRISVGDIAGEQLRELLLHFLVE